MAEQFRFNQIRGAVITIKNGQSFFFSSAMIMNCPGDQFLTGSGFTDYHNFTVCRGNFVNKPIDLLHQSGPADQAKIRFGMS